MASSALSYATAKALKLGESKGNEHIATLVPAEVTFSFRVRNRNLVTVSPVPEHALGTVLRLQPLVTRKDDDQILERR